MDRKSNHCSNLISHGGVSSTQLSFKPRILRGFQKLPKLNPGKNYHKNLTYFFVLAVEVLLYEVNFSLKEYKK